jgi:hypothetical protein
MFGRSRITTVFYGAVHNLQRPSNGLIIGYSTVYDRLHTVKYGRNTAPTKRVRCSLKQSFTTMLSNLGCSGRIP